MSLTQQKLPLKTRFLNIFRQILKFSFIETWLLKYSIGASPGSLIFKIVPSNYLYKKGSLRQVTREEINYKLDISEFVDWYIYYGFLDPGHQDIYKMVKKDSVIFDIGTNVGWVLMNFAKRAPSGFVHGFEPMKVNFERCQRNLMLNDFKNVNVNNLGLGNSKSEQEMSIVNQSNLGMSRISSEKTEHSSTIQITTIDDYMKEGDIKSLDVVKIDVEGFEFEVLKGGKKTIAEFKPDMFIELNDLNLGPFGASVKDVFQFLTDLGYRIWDGFDGKEIKNPAELENRHMDIIARIEKN